MPSTARNRTPRAATVRLRAAIREAIYTAEDAGEPCPTLAELCALLNVSRDALRYHLSALVAAGELDVRETRRRVYCRPGASVIEEPTAEPTADKGGDTARDGSV